MDELLTRTSTRLRNLAIVALNIALLAGCQAPIVGDTTTEDSSNEALSEPIPHGTYRPGTMQGFSDTLLDHLTVKARKDDVYTACDYVIDGYVSKDGSCTFDGNNVVRLFDRGSSRSTVTGRDIGSFAYTAAPGGVSLKRLAPDPSPATRFVLTGLPADVEEGLFAETEGRDGPYALVSNPTGAAPDALRMKRFGATALTEAYGPGATPTQMKLLESASSVCSIRLHDADRWYDDCTLVKTFDASSGFKLSLHVLGTRDDGSPVDELFPVTVKIVRGRKEGPYVYSWCDYTTIHQIMRTDLFDLAMISIGPTKFEHRLHVEDTDDESSERDTGVGCQL